MKWLIFILLISCGGDPPPRALEPKEEPVRDCYTFVSWMSKQARKCDGDLTAKWIEDKMIYAVNCENVFEVRDRELLYGKCKEETLLLTCKEILQIKTPKICNEMFYYWID